MQTHSQKKSLYQRKSKEDIREEKKRIKPSYEEEEKKLPTWLYKKNKMEHYGTTNTSSPKKIGKEDSIEKKKERSSRLVNPTEGGNGANRIPNYSQKVYDWE